MKKWFSYLFRVFVGVLILFFLFKSIDIKQAIELFKNVNLFWISLAFVSILGIRFLMSIRWHVILKTQDLNYSLKELTRITFISMSFGQLLPSGLGTDIAKGYQLIKKYGNMGDISATILIDRFIGIFSMFFLAFVCAIIAKYLGTTIDIVHYLFISQVLLVTGWIFIYLLRKKLREAQLFNNQKIQRIWSKLMAILYILTDLDSLKKIFLKIFTISMIIQIIRAVIFYFIFNAFGGSVGIIYFLIFIPLMFIIVLLPVSVGGIGVREGSLVYFFGSLGISNEISVSAGIAFLILQLLAAVPGIVLWIIDQKARDKQSAPLKEASVSD